jgi:vacuolar-type H+-ATPase subunit E/Vma4
MEVEAQLIEHIIKRRKEQLARSDKMAERLLKSAENEVEKIKAENDRQILSLVGSELRAVRDRIVGKAELDGRKLIMQSRHEMLSKVFEEAEKRLVEIAEGKDDTVDYGVILGKLIVEAASAIGGNEFVVSANERDKGFIKKNLKELNNQIKTVLSGGVLKLDDITLDIKGGIVVRNNDDTKTFYNTFEGRLKRVKSRTEAEIGKVIGVL